MSVSDVAGVFSRYFIVGFFLPALSALIAFSITASSELLPHSFERHGSGTQILILGGAAILLGLLLLGLNHPIVRTFEGYPLRDLVRWLDLPGRRAAWKPVARLVTALQNRLERRQQARRATLLAIRDRSSDAAEQGRAAWRLDRCFPRAESALLPTSFGNAIRAFETHSIQRWGLDGIAVAPRINALMSDKEHEIHADAKAEMAFFVNLALLTGVLALMWIVDLAVAQPLAWYATPVYVLPFVLAYAFYRAAIGAAQRWGSTVRSAIDLHRLELYEKIGVREPESFREERRTIGPAVSRCFLHGNRLPDQLWASRAESESPEGGTS